jgi:nicotinamidase-related amidase
MSSVLLLIDVQRNMLLPPEPVPAADAVAAAIGDVLDRARAAGALVVHVRNNGGTGEPDAPDTPGWQLIHEVRVGERVVDKEEPDAFAGTDLADLLPAAAEVVVVGMQSDYCVRATSLAALRRGHQVTLVRGAHATYDDEEPAGTIAAQIETQLHAAGATVVDRVEVRFG